jgi:hypothetical protein
MSFQLPYAAELDTVNQMLSYFMNNSYMRLLASAITVSTATTITECLAVEATFGGYAPYPLTSWPPAAIDGSGAAATTNTGYWVPTSGGGTGNIYGYFLCDSAASYFYGVEVFSTGPVSAPISVQLAVALTYTGLSRY